MDNEDRKSLAKAMSIVSQLALTGIVCLVLALLIGVGLDRWLNTSPIFIIIFSLLGCAAAIKAMMDIARKI